MGYFGVSVNSDIGLSTLSMRGALWWTFAVMPSNVASAAARAQAKARMVQRLL